MAITRLSLTLRKSLGFHAFLRASGACYDYLFCVFSLIQFVLERLSFFVIGSCHTVFLRTRLKSALIKIP